MRARARPSPGGARPGTAEAHGGAARVPRRRGASPTAMTTTSTAAAAVAAAATTRRRGHAVAGGGGGSPARAVALARAVSALRDALNRLRLSQSGALAPGARLEKGFSRSPGQSRGVDLEYGASVTAGSYRSFVPGRLNGAGPPGPPIQSTPRARVTSSREGPVASRPHGPSLRRGGPTRALHVRLCPLLAAPRGPQRAARRALRRGCPAARRHAANPPWRAAGQCLRHPAGRARSRGCRCAITARGGAGVAPPGPRRSGRAAARARARLPRRPPQRRAAAPARCARGHTPSPMAPRLSQTPITHAPRRRAGAARDCHQRARSGNNRARERWGAGGAGQVQAFAGVGSGGRRVALRAGTPLTG
jgi:hypothetical protein